MLNPYNRDTLLNDLRDHVVEVSFTKVNGQNRVMRCTLRLDLLPPDFVKEDADSEKKFHEENANVIAAWDVQKGGWRSFRIDSIEWAQVVDGY